jgi:hypothetical protein
MSKLKRIETSKIIELAGGKEAVRVNVDRNRSLSRQAIDKWIKHDCVPVLRVPRLAKLAGVDKRAIKTDPPNHFEE